MTSSSSSSTLFLTSSSSSIQQRRRTTTRTNVLITNKLSLPSSSPLILQQRSLRSTNHHVPRNTTKSSYKYRQSNIIFMEWQDCTYFSTPHLVKMEIDVPISVAYNCYLDREAIPRWMPFISSVKILEDKPELSRWTLKYTAFGRDLEFSWLARNMQPIPNQKIHWRSLEGLPNKGAVRFFPKGSSSCLVELTVSYEVPQLLAPVAAVSTFFVIYMLIWGNRSG